MNLLHIITSIIAVIMYDKLKTDLGEQPMGTRWIAKISCLMVILCLGCDTTTQKGKRDKQNDSICATKNQQAYIFDEPNFAKSIGCSEVRQHQGKIDPETGKVENVEMLIWCCPQ